MQDTGNGYALDYSAKNKNLSDLFDNESTNIKIPKFLLVEPIGYAEKYNYSVDDFNDKSDFEIIVDQQAFDLRVKKGYFQQSISADIPFMLIYKWTNFVQKTISFLMVLYFQILKDITI